jgi:hypothetical protein
MRYISDERLVDGPLRTRVYANEPGPLYLTHGRGTFTAEDRNVSMVAGGKREPEGGTRLVRWGSWLGGQK